MQERIFVNIFYAQGEAAEEFLTLARTSGAHSVLVMLDSAGALDARGAAVGVANETAGQGTGVMNRVRFDGETYLVTRSESLQYIAVDRLEHAQALAA